MNTRTEQRLLKASIVTTVLVGVGGIGAGLLLNASAIVFDGVYSLIDVVLTIASLVVARLVAVPGSRRFQFGYWHLEPLLVLIGGAILSTACVYAALDGIEGLLRGGHVVDFGSAIAWAAVLAIVGFCMAFYMRRRARALSSALLAMDSRSWLVSGLLSFALLFGFGLALLLEGTALAHWIPLVDPAVLLAVALITLPLPVMGSARALREILQLAPASLDRRVRALMEEVVREHGFAGYTSYVQQMGRALFVEIHVLVHDAEAPVSVARADAVRRHVLARLGEGTPYVWLTLDFTADREWM